MSEFDNINFEAQSRIMGDDSSTRNAKVKVFGVGGAGGNTVNRMKQMNIDGVEYYAVNTDAMALDLSLADHKIVIGEKTTKGLGAGMDPDKASKAVEENIEELKEAMKGADMVFVTAGMGGGTGTGAAPIVANVAREMGILTVAVVTKPFRFEGNARSSIAQSGIKALRECVDTIIVVENKKLLTLLQSSNQKATMEEAFKMADEILGNAVQSICGIMFHHGLVHVDFADIRKVMLKGGSALMGTGCAQGEKRGIAAADLALASPLLEDINIEGASGVLINVAHGENYSLLEHSDAMEHIYEKVGEEGNPNIIIGDITVPELGDKVCITIIATGCGGTSNAQPAAPSFTAAQTMQMTGFAPNPVFGASQPTVAVPAAAPAVQQATPRPTSVNFFAEAMASAAPAAAPAVAPAAVAPVAPAVAPAAPQVAPEMFTRRMAPAAAVAQPRPVEVAPAIATVAPAVASAFASPAFDATATAVAEEVITRGSDTSEFSTVADEDRYNGGCGGYEEPAFTRKQASMERQPVVEESLKDSTQDYSIPAYLRSNFNDNF
ncbi:cell division protein FtsZ [Fibrobacter sp. UWEL]|uniref:cell division protein FtsZ n=1 Tax=Fibrobacter sp. UWEL TaxID=1896209 RepID=UPI0009126063|nr:cell division protein FtsZ [Fibrobacter sp. UWEL]SHK56183.1 cell division protein FtsZ [Fibrobacter sp. UWEL]